MKPPYKVKSFYQVRTSTGMDVDQTVSCNSFDSYNKARDNFEEEVKEAKHEYLVELLSITETQETEDESKTESHYLTLGDNL